MLKLIRSLRLADPRPHYAASGDGRRFVACSKAGAGLLLDDNLEQLVTLALPPNIEWLQLNDDASLLLVGYDDHVAGYAVGHAISRSLTLPVAGTSYLPCVFSRDEPVVCIASWYRDLVLTAYDLLSGKVVAEHPLPARGGEGYSLVPHPEGEAMAAIAFSGNSEDWLFWAHYRDGRLRVFDRPEIRDVSLPQFHPRGGEFVSHHEQLGLCRMRFPSGELIASVQPEDAFPDDPDDDFGYDVHYLGNDRILAWQTDLALYEFDLGTLRPLRRVLSGVDGKTFGENGFFSGPSWALAGRRLLTSDRQFDATIRTATETLRLWGASELCVQPVTPDPERPFTKQLLAMS